LYSQEELQGTSLSLGSFVGGIPSWLPNPSHSQMKMLLLVAVLQLWDIMGLFLSIVSPTLHKLSIPISSSLIFFHLNLKL
jgi:hypothetical protein